MPNIQGIEVCKAIRRSSQVPVVLMSGSRREADMIQAFQAGADDFVTKPISIQHLALRLTALSRRAAGQNADVTPRRLVFDRLSIDLDAFSVTVDDNPVRLTRLEFRLLYCLAANLGRVVSSSRLIDFAWGLDGEGDASLLKTHFSHIRRKLQGAAPDAPFSIRAFPGAGYSFQLEG
jgi:DNA-binding response OmpR family regulator